jgi:hypothetical protein
MRPLFFNQKIAAKEPEKKIPSTAANATIRSPNVDSLSLIQVKAHSALRAIGRIVWIALKSFTRSADSRIYVSMRREYTSAWMFSLWNRMGIMHGNGCQGGEIWERCIEDGDRQSQRVFKRQ